MYSVSSSALRRSNILQPSFHRLVVEDMHKEATQDRSSGTLKSLSRKWAYRKLKGLRTIIVATKAEYVKYDRE